jgi:hypothetical protein
LWDALLEKKDLMIFNFSNNDDRFLIEKNFYFIYFCFVSKESQPEAEAALSPKQRKRKTTQDAHGSFFLRVGAIGNVKLYFGKYLEINFGFFVAFGLGAMIYIGLEFGSFFETPIGSPCHEILRGVNPLLQMIFTFMQMYFIFMNSRVRCSNALSSHHP